MSSPTSLEECPLAPTEVDPIEEMRLRTWARRNYLPVDDRPTSWHPIVLDEMLLRDQEDEREPIFAGR